MEFLRLENVEKYYETDEKTIPLKGLSLSLNTGDFISIEGPSGMGKSTLLYVMGGLLNVSSGDIFIEGENIKDMNDKVLSNIRREKIGFIFQDSTLIKALTIEENLYFIQSITGKKKDPEKIKDVLTRLGLYEKRNHLPNELSGGQRRRAMIACTIIKDPVLILADEPTNDLDENWSNEVLDILSNVSNEGKIVVLVTHNTNWAERAKTRYILNYGVLSKK